MKIIHKKIIFWTCAVLVNHILMAIIIYMASPELSLIQSVRESLWAFGLFVILILIFASVFELIVFVEWLYSKYIE